MRTQQDQVQERAIVAAVGRRIRNLREDRKFAQEDFALEAGIDRAYYGAIERGTKNVGLVMLVRIARALNVEVGELFPTIGELFPDHHADS